MSGSTSSTSNSNNNFERLKLRHIPEESPQSARRRQQYNVRHKIRAPMKLDFEHEKFTKYANNARLPAWAHDSRRIIAERSAKRENAHDGRFGMSEFLYRDFLRRDKIIEGIAETRFAFEPRPLGTIGLSCDDCFVRSLPNDVKAEDFVSAGNDNWKVDEFEPPSGLAALISSSSSLSASSPNQKTLQLNSVNNIQQQQQQQQQKQLTGNGTTNEKNDRKNQPSSAVIPLPSPKPIDFKNYDPQIVDTPHGLDLAPLPKEGKKKAVFVVRVKLAAGTTAEALFDGIRQRVQNVRHQAAHFREEFVPCDVRLESGSNGFLCGTVGTAMEVNCRVRTWAAAHHCLLPSYGAAPRAAARSSSSIAAAVGEAPNKKQDSGAGDGHNVFAWTSVRGGGKYCITSCCSLWEWKEQRVFTQPSVTEYSLIVRGAADCPMNTILEPLKKIRDRGFINYGSSVYFGLPIENSINFARAFVEGRFTSCFIHHFLCLARVSFECTEAVHQLSRRLSLLTQNDSGGGGGLGRKSSSYSPSASLQRNIKFEWKTFIATIETTLDNEKHLCASARANAGDLDLQPLHKLLELARHVEQLDGDCTAAMIDSRLIPDVIVSWHLKSLADLHFNTLASIRIRKYGSQKVVVGDVVCRDESLLLLGKLDASGGTPAPAFSVPCSGSLTFDRNESGSNIFLQQQFQEGTESECEMDHHHHHRASPFKLIESAAEAREYKPSSIVLPKWGLVPPQLASQEADENKQCLWLRAGIGQDDDSHLHNRFFNWPSSSSSSSSSSAQFPLPTASGIDWESCASISKSLKIPSLLASSSSSFSSINYNSSNNNNNNNYNNTNYSNDLTKLFPLASYRPLFAKPRWLYAHCWDTRSVSSSASCGLDATLMQAPDLHVFPTEVDCEGWRRMLTLGADMTNSSATAASSLISPDKIRPAIRQADVREIMTAAIPKKCITTGLRIALPTGVALSSALREVFQMRIFESREVSSRIAENVALNNKKVRGRLVSDDQKARRRSERESMEF